ncbi:hypothetical protein [Sorangium sp. So ce363]|uniref:hypothetical protein n=1 Tax=Sorangium sp. So ce363 TaxID=3133304 RepID=UPI003F642994
MHALRPQVEPLRRAGEGLQPLEAAPARFILEDFGPALRAERAAGRAPASRCSSGRLPAAPVVEAEAAAELLQAVAGDADE